MEIIMWILVYPTEKRTLIQKMAEWDDFLMKPKHEYHLSQWGECVYDAQSWKERGLLGEPMFVEIDQRTLFLKMVEREVFLGKPKPRFIYPNKENDFVVPNH